MGIAYNTSIVSDGLVYALDAANSRSYPGTGLTAFGLIGLNGTLVNGVGFSSLNNGSFFFDGTNDYVEFPSYTPDANTVSIWVNFKNYENGPIVYVGDDTYNSGLWSWSFFMVMPIFYIRANPGPFAYFNETPPLNTWINYTLVRNNGSNLSFTYKNGVSFGSTTDSTTTNTYPNMRFGIAGGQAANFNLSQVLIYNRALSAQEVRQNYNATKKRYGL
jgi:hypothetical protein